MTDDAIETLRQALALPTTYLAIVEAVHRPIAERLARARAQHGAPIVVGICGSQASGKTTLSAFLEALLEEAGLKAAVLSIDDLYLSRPARRALANAIDPLLITRGPPGTHNTALGMDLLDGLTGRMDAAGMRMPCFDKAADTLVPREQWPPLAGAVDVVLFEGWCVGARPQPEAALGEPINALERDLDIEAVWRTYCNRRLAEDYAALFAKIDLLLMLQAPSFEVVFDWRSLQERKLGEKLAREGGLGGERKLMTAEELSFFLEHYERLTRHILDEMPPRADILVTLAEDHAVTGLEMR